MWVQLQQGDITRYIVEHLTYNCYTFGLFKSCKFFFENEYFSVYIIWILLIYFFVFLLIGKNRSRA
jgi:hypothetical protein